jgi:hypothetical protein
MSIPIPIPMKAAIIYKTEESIDCDRVNIREQFEELFDDPDIFELKEYTDDESMYKLIQDVLGNTSVGVNSLGVTACNIWENKDVLYAGYYIDLTELTHHMSDNSKNIKLNILGSQITSQHVTGNLVIIKKKLTYLIEDNNVKTNTIMDTINQYTLLDTLENIFIKEGIVLEVSGNMSSYKYIMNPLEHLMLTDNNYEQHYIYHEYEVYTHVMIIIVDVREINGTLNEKATLLAGHPVNGTVFVAMYRKPEYNENPPYISLSMDRLTKILTIREKSASLTTGKERADREYINFDYLLDLECHKHSQKIPLIATQINGEYLNVK